MTLLLPDCRAATPAIELSDEEKRELVLAIATGGVAAIDDYVRAKEAADSSIARKVRALREELVRRAEELRARFAGEFAARKETRVAAYEDEQRALASERSALEERLASAREASARAFETAAFEVPLWKLALEAQTRPAPWWRRALDAVLRALRALLAFVLAPLRWLLGGRRAGPRGRRAIVARRGVVLDLSLARLDPRVRRAVRDRLRSRPPKERLREAWNRLLAREDYEAVVQRLMEEQIREEEHRLDADRQAKEEAFRAKLEDLAHEEDDRKRALDDALARLEKERAEAEAQVARDAERGPHDAAREEVLSELEDAGLLRRAGDQWAVTERLVARFAEIVFAEEARRLGGSRGRTTGAWSDGEGNWVREPMLSVDELSHMDLLGSAVRARTRTPRGRELRLYEDDVVVYREERGARHHVVIIFDRSGSMEENGRLEAAQRAVLALWHAVKRDAAANRVDILAMDTSVAAVDLRGVWESKPRGFTNTGNALKRAGDLLRAGRSERGIVYLITDGLPEAYTKDGEDIASTPEKCLAYALEQARDLKRRTSAELAVILLEPEDALYVKAANAIATELGGRVFEADPGELAGTMLQDFDRAALRATGRPRRA